MRSFDPALAAPAIEFFLKSTTKVDPIKWTSDTRNILLTNDAGDLALFEPGIRNVYSGHYFFQSKGKAAIHSGKGFLKELFTYDIPVLIGLCPLTNLGARWMSRQIGFTSYGVIKSHEDRPYELFIITKKEFDERTLRG